MVLVQRQGRTTIVVLEEQRGSDGHSSYRPVVEYEVDGKSYRCTGKVWVGTNLNKVGDKIAVLYQIDRPEIGYVDSFSQRWAIPLVFCILGGFFLSGFLHYALFGRKSKNQDDPSWHNVRVDETNGRRIVIRWFSSLCWGLLMFCVVWNAFLIMVGLENLGILVLPTVLAGVAVTYLTLALFFNRTTVKVSEFEIRVWHWPFPWIGNKVLPCEKIRHLCCVPGLTITGAAGPYKSLVNIKATLSDGSECLLLRSLDKADGLTVQRQLEKWLKATAASVASEVKKEHEGESAV